MRDVGGQCCAPEGSTFASPLPALVNAPYCPLIHASCRCNELAALRLRVFRQPPEPLPGSLLALKRQRRRFAQVYIERFGRALPLSLDETVQRFPLHKRALYTQAAESLRVRACSRADAKVKMFVKADKFDNAAAKGYTGKPLKPRAIQARSPRFNVALGRFVKAFEGNCLAMRGWRSPTRTTMFAKGFTQQELAHLFREKLAGFSEPVVVSMDATTFDASIRVEHLRSLHALYEQICPHPEMARTLSWRYMNKCKSLNGVEYVVHGGRMSGDVDTALGNCIDMVCFVATVMHQLKVRVWDALDNGDDCLIIMEKAAFPGTDAIKRRMAHLGIKCDPEVAGDRLEDVEFCRSRIVRTALGITWMPRPRRFLANLGVSHVLYGGSQGDYLSSLKSIAYCALVTYPGTPVVSECARVVYDALAHKDLAGNMWGREYSYNARMNRRRGHTLADVDVTPEARASVERAFKMSIEEQRAIVGEFKRLVTKEFFLGHSFTHLGHAALPLGGDKHLYLQAHLP